MNDDLRRRLEEAGRRPVPGPDQAFADGLEARLLAVAASLPPVAPPPPRRTRLRKLLGGTLQGRTLLGGTLLAGAAVTLVIAIGAGVGRPIAPPELEAPVNTEVALVDGTVLEDPDGLQLPEGAVVSVGEGGSARVGDTLLRPGDMATVEQGRLRVEHGQPVGSITAGRPTPTPTPSQSPIPTPSPSPTRRPSPGSTLAPGATPPPSRTATPGATPAPTRVPASPNPAPTREPTRTPAPTPAPARTPAPTRSAPPPTAQPTPTPTASPTIIRPRLRARFVAPDGIRVTRTSVKGASSYNLEATGNEVVPPPRPRNPGGRVIGKFAHVPEAPLRFRVPGGIVEVRLLVVALAPDGRVISRSRVVILATGG